MKAGIAVNADADLLRAAFPLFEQEKVGVVEWAFDTLYDQRTLPPWFEELLGHYSSEGALLGHGVFFSLFSARWSPQQAAWLTALKALSRRFSFDHVTEHFGFMTGSDFHKGAPLNIPYNHTTLAIGQDRLARIQDACGCPVGLENLAFTWSADEAKKQGSFLEKLVTHVNGFIILDLHNLYCQLHNFKLGFEDMARFYPLHLVREIHISGGSWDSVAGRQIRRDTHDDQVPADVFDLLEMAIPLCPNLRFVILEQIGQGLVTGESQMQYQKDFLRLEMMLQHIPVDSGGRLDFSPLLPAFPSVPPEDILLAGQQSELCRMLESTESYEQLQHELKNSGICGTDWAIESWEPEMLETARRIAAKWKNGFFE
ncbi:MAG: DUF692 family protein [Sphingobacteriales bacterium]|nr:MAG: DUF692 family protein [Sphingobacteriales bacterium]